MDFEKDVERVKKGKVEEILYFILIGLKLDLIGV